MKAGRGRPLFTAAVSSCQWIAATDPARRRQPLVGEECTYLALPAFKPDPPNLDAAKHSCSRTEFGFLGRRAFGAKVRQREFHRPRRKLEKHPPVVDRTQFGQGRGNRKFVKTIG
jgi:hypothetical protein